jgi:hypothetical protein
MRTALAKRPPLRAERDPPKTAGQGPTTWAVVASDGREFVIKAGRVEWEKRAALFYSCDNKTYDFDGSPVAIFEAPVSVVKVAE